MSLKGYKKDSPDVNKPYNVIPGGNITMKGVEFKVLGTDDRGYTKVMYPGSVSYTHLTLPTKA